MLQLHLSDQQFYYLLRCDLYYRFEGISFRVSLALWWPYDSPDAIEKTLEIIPCSWLPYFHVSKSALFLPSSTILSVSIDIAWRFLSEGYWKKISCKSTKNSQYHHNKTKYNKPWAHAVWSHYNTVNFFPKVSQWAPHSSLVRVRYGVSFMSSKSDSCSVPINAVLYVI